MCKMPTITTTLNKLETLPCMFSFKHLINGQGNYADCEILLIGSGSNEYTFYLPDNIVLKTNDNFIAMIKIADYVLANEMSAWIVQKILKEPYKEYNYELTFYGFDQDNKFFYYNKNSLNGLQEDTRVDITYEDNPLTNTFIKGMQDEARNNQINRINEDKDWRRAPRDHEEIISTYGVRRDHAKWINNNIYEEMKKHDKTYYLYNKAVVQENESLIYSIKNNNDNDDSSDANSDANSDSSDANSDANLTNLTIN
jgi:hypothetical protein